MGGGSVAHGITIVLFALFRTCGITAHDLLMCMGGHTIFTVHIRALLQGHQLCLLVSGERVIGNGGLYSGEVSSTIKGARVVIGQCHLGFWLILREVYRAVFVFLAGGGCGNAAAHPPCNDYILDGNHNYEFV